MQKAMKNRWKNQTSERNRWKHRRKIDENPQGN